MQYLYEDELLVNPTTTRTKYADNKYSEITAVYDSKYGGVISSTDASGNTTDYKYDDYGNIVYRKTDAGEKKNTFMIIATEL